MIFSVEMTSAGNNHGQRDIEAASQEEAIEKFFETMSVVLQPCQGSNHVGWSQLVISVSPQVVTQFDE